MKLRRACCGLLLAVFALLVGSSHGDEFDSQNIRDNLGIGTPGEVQHPEGGMGHIEEPEIGFGWTDPGVAYGLENIESNPYAGAQQACENDGGTWHSSNVCTFEWEDPSDSEVCNRLGGNWTGGECQF
ncbi:hypothetical protein TK90_2837 (plasmid) [Thioalkalivibrio sp. K90mix]|uniref:hypothetical protein n=1 Tax=Thioalkalivibrio sp. (strain K90mix) TaxID=396595 RepID=UPI000195A83D|nr:hypothetical protein [Thioalkalivibrio sp. K90mix]ADC73322.1 hypothetical protein TK90_2837 [Thioalkalivibrio sp. K90mix]